MSQSACCQPGPGDEDDDDGGEGEDVDFKAGVLTGEMGREGGGGSGKRHRTQLPILPGIVWNILLSG